LTVYIDIEIVQGCKDGLGHFQKLLYDRYKDAMFTICKRMISDDDLACDALQEGFVEVFRGIHSFKSDATIGAWIKTIIIRKAILVSKRFLQTEEIIPSQHDIVIHWDSNLTGQELNLAINKLPAGYKNVFLMIEVEGYTHRETAEMMGISEGTSKSQLFHAKKLLQKSLAELKN
jgi:RNA polymerase sigma factor (sigma-70 family)